MPGCIIEYLSGHLYVDILKKEVVPCRHAYSSFFFFLENVTFVFMVLHF